jgi:phosphoglycolate phosphatase-like HAD superfamily hydrolase
MRKKIPTELFIVIILSGLILSCGNNLKQYTAEKNGTGSDPLPSWNNGSAKQRIINFVVKSVSGDSSDFIQVSDRIACFDNDGCLWTEQPYYFQLAFAVDQVKKLAPGHPEWKSKQPFKALLENDMKTVIAGGEHALLEIVMATHAGMTTEEFEGSVREWINSARHPVTGRLYKDMAFKPMLELLDYLRANGFKTFIVSGGGADFIRPWSEEVYGIPPDQVVGSSGKVEYKVIDGKPVLIKLPEINFIDDKEGKPVGIHQYIGKRPVFTAGNSDGDYAMLQWTTTGPGPRFGMIVHHTDPVREYAYDRESSVGRLNKGLDDAQGYNWLVVDMKKDWKVIYKP